MIEPEQLDVLLVIFELQFDLIREYECSYQPKWHCIGQSMQIPKILPIDDHLEPKLYCVSVEKLFSRSKVSILL